MGTTLYRSDRGRTVRLQQTSKDAQLLMQVVKNAASDCAPKQ